MTRLQIFRPGRHTAMSGEALAFSEADVKAIAERYDPALHEAPIVIGHPELNKPAFGWVKSLHFQNGILEAEVDQLDPAFAQLVNEGKFKKVSSRFFKPEAAHNPKPGAFYLEHVGFLGAAAPAVSGLKAASFAAADQTVAFAFGRFARIAGMFRGLRDLLVSQFGLDAADKAIPGWTIDDLAASDEEEPTAAYSQPADPAGKLSKELNVSDPNKPSAEERERQLAARERKLNEDQAAFAQRQAEIRKSEDATFVDSLVTQGRVLPANKDSLATFLAKLDDGETVSFAAGKQETARAFFRGFLSGLPQQVKPKQEIAGGALPNGSASFAKPADASGHVVNQEKLELHGKAVAFQKQHAGVSYLDAVKAVEGQ